MASSSTESGSAAPFPHPPRPWRGGCGNGGAEPDSVRIAGWAREAGGLEPGTPVDVVERAVHRSGWPPFEVRIGYDTGHGRHERTVPKRLARVSRLDVLAAWREGDTCCGP